MSSNKLDYLPLSPFPGSSAALAAYVAFISGAIFLAHNSQVACTASDLSSNNLRNIPKGALAPLNAT